MIGPRVSSEVGQLRACVGCGPGSEFDRMLPRHIEAASLTSQGTLEPNPDYLLFDDLVLRDVLAREHRILFDVIRAAVGDAQVFDLRDLLIDVLVDPAVRAEVVEEVAALERRIGAELSEAARGWLLDASPRQCAQALLSGARPDGTALMRWPMPNWLFARDCMAVVGDVLVQMRPRHPARWRDGVLARTVAAHAPIFRGLSVVDVANSATEDTFIEGGDVLVVSERLVLVGVGIRTNAAGARALAVALAPRGVEVIGVRLPVKRAAMHLDTLFTLLDRDCALAYTPVLAEQGSGSDGLQLFDPRSGGSLVGGLSDALAARGHELTWIPCGDGDPIAARREQWTDGANAFCLAPGRALLYGRNRYTLRALNRAGFEIITPDEFVRNAALRLQGEQRWVIAIDGFELSRGRGGPRCLTLPLWREP